MKELVVVSGKGGTGKTSVVASFAVLERSKVMADCDVDASNLHLVLAPKVQRSETYLGGKVAVIDSERCSRCWRCADVCRFGALTGRRTGAPEVAPLHCEGCGACSIVCPEDAIGLRDVETGEWYVSETRAGPLVHATLGAGRENSGRLVTVVRSQAAILGTRRSLALSLIDGPPGIGCPVIASLTGADLALAVTEPSAAGLHDLERAVGLARKLGVRVAVAVNKWDLSDAVTAETENWCRERGIPVAGRIPYDDAVTRAQVRGSSVVEDDTGPASTAMRELWHETRSLLGL
jgi:MinD superfamily P-loop ATPase